MGWLALLPLIGAAALAITIANACVKRGWRLLGVLSSLTIGGICILVGYSLGIEGITDWQADGVYLVKYPVLGWIGMIGGGLIALLGSWTALAGTKEQIEQREYLEVQEKDFKNKLRSEVKGWAKEIIKAGRIDDYERCNSIIKSLSEFDVLDIEAEKLLRELKALKTK